MLSRRGFLSAGAVLCASAYITPKTLLGNDEMPKQAMTKAMPAASADELALQKKFLSIGDKEWKQKLTAKQYDVLRKDGTEMSGSSPLNAEKRDGTYHCVACENPLFASETKFESGTGWPSFYDHLPNAVNTKKDFKMIWPRTEYHCARCGGHQGHVFKDGPKPTGLRYCNNGVALKFVPKEA